MRVGIRTNNSGVSAIVELDMAAIWSFGRSYDDALGVFGGKGNKEWDAILEKMKEVDDNISYPECIIIYDSKSDIVPRFFDKTNLDNVVGNMERCSTTARPAIIELFVYEDGKCRELFDRALVNGYIDFKDFDAAMVTYENIPENSGSKIEKVFMDLGGIK